MPPRRGWGFWGGRAFYKEAAPDGAVANRNAVAAFSPGLLGTSYRGFRRPQTAQPCKGWIVRLALGLLVMPTSFGGGEISTFDPG